MQIRSMIRLAVAAFGSASMTVAVAGCTSSKMTASPRPAVAEEAPKKEYQWKDMSTGKSFFRPIDRSSKD